MTRRAHRATRAHMYVDESAASDYLVIGALVASADVARARAAMKGLLLPGQRSLHMKNERNRAGQILGVVIELQPRVLIYRVERGVPAMEARSRCVRALARDACELGVARVVFDAIESVVDRDRSWVNSGSRSAGRRIPPFTYHHQRRHEEPLLWIADAVGWAWARGAGHRRMVESIIDRIIDL